MKIEIRADLFEFDDNHIDAIVIDGVPHVFAQAIGEAVGQRDGEEAFTTRGFAVEGDLI